MLDSAPGRTARAPAARASVATERAALREQVSYSYEVKKWEKTPFERPTKQAQLKAKNTCAVIDAPEPCDGGAPGSHALDWRGRRYVSLQYALHGAPEVNGAEESGTGAAATKSDATPATSGGARVGPYAKLRGHWTRAMWQAVSPSHKSLVGCTTFAVWVDEDSLRAIAAADDDPDRVDADPPTISWFVWCESDRASCYHELVWSSDAAAVGAPQRWMQAFALVDFGRRFARTLVFTTDARRSLRWLAPRVGGFETLPVRGLRHQGGSLFGGLEHEAQRSFELEITRTWSRPAGEGAGLCAERFLPSRVLQGLLPEALLEAYVFWEQRARATKWGRIVGYARRRRIAGAEGKLGEEVSKEERSMWGDHTIRVETSAAGTGAGGGGARRAPAAPGTAPGSGPVPLLRCQPSSDTHAPPSLFAPAAALVRRVPRSAGGGDSPELLLNLQAARAGGAIHRLTRHVRRLDALSNVLLWSPSRGRVGDEVALGRLELPRLRLRFDAKASEEDAGRIKLASLNYSGMFLAEEPSGDALLKARLAPIPHALVLTNAKRERSLLVPNFGVERIAVKNAPFGSMLTLDRGRSWWEHVNVRYFLYSASVVDPLSADLSPSLAASLYLVLLRMMFRDYDGAVQHLNMCYTDLPLTDEQRWIALQLLLHSYLPNKDFHPGAHALRLRVALFLLNCDVPIVAECDAKECPLQRHLSATLRIALKGALKKHSLSALIKEMLEADLQKYHAKIAVTSVVCRLSVDEERAIALALTGNDPGAGTWQWRADGGGAAAASSIASRKRAEEGDEAGAGGSAEHEAWSDFSVASGAAIERAASLGKASIALRHEGSSVTIDLKRFELRRPNGAVRAIRRGGLGKVRAHSFFSLLFSP